MEAITVLTPVPVIMQTPATQLVSTPSDVKLAPTTTEPAAQTPMTTTLMALAILQTAVPTILPKQLLELVVVAMWM